jgi:hypothetical protein
METDMNQCWYALNLGDAMLAGPELDRIINLFQTPSVGHQHSDNQALFIRHESEGRLHCDAVVYFPPSCSALAQQLGARVCTPPPRQDLGLLAGEENAWSVYFPE